MRLQDNDVQRWLYLILIILVCQWGAGLYLAEVIYQEMTHIETELRLMRGKLAVVEQQDSLMAKTLSRVLEDEVSRQNDSVHTKQ